MEKETVISLLPSIWNNLSVLHIFSGVGDRQVVCTGDHSQDVSRRPALYQRIRTKTRHPRPIGQSGSDHDPLYRTWIRRCESGVQNHHRDRIRRNVHEVNCVLCADDQVFKCAEKSYTSCLCTCASCRFGKRQRRLILPLTPTVDNVRTIRFCSARRASGRSA